MDYVLVIIVALGASMLTFFSGFGLGTMLTPAFILFFPPEIAVAATAIVHFLNNLFKLSLIGRHAKMNIVLAFGLPAILGAFIGAKALGWISNLDTLNTTKSLGAFGTPVVNVTIGILIIFFALFELIPKLKKLEFSTSWLIPGGFISGLFGGISGHQGALRSAFLIKFPLTKEQFVASGIVIACFIDFVRIGTYAFTFDFNTITDSVWLIIMATASAFLGAFIGKKLMKKVTISFLQSIVGIMMILIGIALITNLI